MIKTDYMKQAGKDVHMKTWMLALYFICMAFDSFSLGTFGSLIRIVAFFPVIAALMDFQNLTLKVDRFIVLLIVFGLIVVSSLFYTINVPVTFHYSTTLILNVGMIILLGGMENYNKREIQLLLKSLVIGGWVTVILSLLLADHSTFGRLTIRFGTSVQDQNVLNGYFIIPFAWHLNKFLKKMEAIHSIPILIIFLVSLMTGSRGAIIAELVMMDITVLWIWKSNHSVFKKFQTVIFIVASAILIYILAPQILPETVAKRFTFSYLKKNGTTGRITIWKTLIDFFIQSPLLRQLFGYGYGTTRFVNTYKNYVAHNLYLDNLISIGIIGMVEHMALQIFYLFEMKRQKSAVLAIAFIGFMTLCCTLSLVSYKPIWNTIIMTLIIHYRRLSENE